MTDPSASTSTLPTGIAAFDADAGSSLGVDQSSQAAPPSSTELMVALSQIQQLFPLLDYRPPMTMVAGPAQCGLSHIIPSLLMPLAPASAQTGIPDSLAAAIGLPNSAQHNVKGYRESVEHALRVAGELERRLAAGGEVAPALALAQSIVQKQAKKEEETERILRVRKKRRIMAQHDDAWAPVNIQESEKTAEPAASTSDLPPVPLDVPRAESLRAYLSAFRLYALDAQRLPIPRAQLRARVRDESTLELQVTSVLHAGIQISSTSPPCVVRVNVLAASEQDTPLFHPSKFPHFRTLTADVFQRAHKPPTREMENGDKSDGWKHYANVTVALEHLVREACTFLGST